MRRSLPALGHVVSYDGPRSIAIIDRRTDYDGINLAVAAQDQVLNLADFPVLKVVDAHLRDHFARASVVCLEPADAKEVFRSG